MMFQVDKISKIIMSPKIFSYTLIWLIVLVFFGTIAQKDIGLYASQMKYFSSFFFLFLGFIPLPGGRLVLLIMTVNLFSSLFKKNLWQLKKIGIIIVHLGGLLLLVGGGLTAYFSSEGNMVIAEGETSNFVDDYHDMELAFVNNSLKDSTEYTVVDESLLYEGSRFQLFDEGPEIYIISNIKNVRIENRISPADSMYKGLLKKFVLLPKTPEPENTQNRPALIYKIEGTSNGSDGIYGLFLGQGLNDPFKIKDQIFHSEYRRERTYVPFNIELINFEKIMHPGTNVAKSFSSDVNLIENDIPRRTLIKMNEPLRHKGYTFFQASFIDDSEIETTVLATVKNYGRLFPYISSIIMSTGLLIHLFLMMPKMVKRKSK